MFVKRGSSCLIGSMMCGLTVAIATSCSRTDSTEASRLPVFPVSGKVLVNHQPADGALVVFHPVGAAQSNDLRPRGKTGPDGSFALGTYKNADGAPAGQYVVTIIWPAGRSGPMPDPDLAPDRLRGRYSNPKTSPLRVRIEQRQQALTPFQLK
ncbi:MAG: hypothetical protein KY476_22630 [Planctomycetes bacterium]|nr:hypothetical protein [Planctomycetota bacterium]